MTYWQERRWIVMMGQTLGRFDAEHPRRRRGGRREHANTDQPSDRRAAADDEGGLPLRAVWLVRVEGPGDEARQDRRPQQDT